MTRKEKKEEALRLKAEIEGRKKTEPAKDNTTEEQRSAAVKKQMQRERARSRRASKTPGKNKEYKDFERW